MLPFIAFSLVLLPGMWTWEGHDPRIPSLIPGSSCFAWSDMIGSYGWILLKEPTLFWFKPLLFTSFVKLANLHSSYYSHSSQTQWGIKKGRKGERGM